MEANGKQTNGKESFNNAHLLANLLKIEYILEHKTLEAISKHNKVIKRNTAELCTNSCERIPSE